MRGKVLQNLISQGIVGITPACAGKSQLVFERFRIFGDHPCVCGEKVNAFDLVRLHKGSPPRVRGKVAAALKDSLSSRITPAYAGKR